MIEEGKSVSDIAKKYGVTRQAVYDRLKKDEEAKKRKAEGYSITNGHFIVDPQTGFAVANTGEQSSLIGKIGDERVGAFVTYHMEMMRMRQGVDKKDVPDLYNRFYRYLAYCAEHNIIPNNMNAYFAIGVSKQDISAWKQGQTGTPDHKQFANDIAAFFASIHEQGAMENIMNPISSIFWQKAHDGLSDQPKVEIEVKDALGERRSAAQIAKDYSDLPD